MSDSSGNAFGEALESMATNTKQAVGGTIADFTKSAVGQVVKGTAGPSGSFTPGQQPTNAPTLSGGEIFSPDQLAGKNVQQISPKPLISQEQISGQTPDAKTPEEAAKIQSIEAELRGMHDKYYQDFLAKAEGRDRKTQVATEEKAQDNQQKQMQDMQQEELKKQESDAVFRAKRASEIKGGLG